MSVLGRPAVVAALLTAAALCLHPALGAAGWLPASELVAATLLLACAAGLASRARAASGSERTQAWAVAVGFALALLGLAIDGVRGQAGTLRLSVGQARNHFDEIGPDRRPLGLRPLPLPIGVRRITAAGGVVLAAGQGAAAVEAEVTPERSAAIGGYRFARPRVRPTGGAARLRVSVTDGAGTQVADVVPGEPVQAVGLSIGLEAYFADFALDERQQPFTRSLEPRNPAALLAVERGGETYRAFVLQSMPGVHRVEPLGLSFSLLDVEPEREVELDVSRSSPIALVLLLAGGATLLAGVALAAWRAAPAGRGALADPALPAAAVYVLALLLAGGVPLLSWSFSVPSGSARVALPGAGVFLGLSLLAASGGTLWLAAVALAGEGGRAIGRGALWLAVSIGAAGLLLAGVRVALQPETTLPMVGPLAGIGLALGLLVLGLRPPLRWLPGATVAAAVAAALAAGAFGLQHAGTYATPASTSATAAVLLGLSAFVPTGLGAWRRLAFLLALVTLLARPA